MAIEVNLFLICATNCHSGLILMCMCCPSGVVDIEAETPRGMCVYVDESCIHGHQMSKGFCTLVINEVCSGSQEGKFLGRTRAQKKISYCSLLLQTGTNTATILKGQPSLFQWLTLGWTWRSSPTLWLFLYMAILLVEACAVITNSTFIQGNFWYIISLKILQQRHLIIFQLECDTKKMIHRFNYVIIIGELNVPILSKNCQSPKFTPRQYFILYSIYYLHLVILHYDTPQVCLQTHE